MANYNVDIIYNGSGSLPGTETLRIDGSANVLVNRTSTLNSSKFAVTGNTWHQNGLAVFSNPGNGESYPNITATAMMLGPYSTRSGTAGKYLAGIGFDHLLNYSTEGNMTYNQSPHGWIGLRTETFPGYETSSLVFATRSDTSGAANSTIERMCITSNGDIQFGYNSTSTVLIGRSFATAHANGNRGGTLKYGIDDGSFGGMIVYNVASGASGYNSQFIAFNTHEGAVSAAERMRITSTGNVGIGTTTPSAKFTVNNSGATSQAFYVDIGNPSSPITLFEHTGASTPVTFRLKKSGYSGAALNYGLLYLHMNDNTVGNGSALYFTLNSSNGTEREYAGVGAVIRSNTNGGEQGDLYFMTLDNGYTRSEKMRITSSGNVGIGTTSPAAKLEVAGTTRTQKLEGYSFSTSGGTIDTAITAADFTVLEVFGSANPNAGGSGAYRDPIHFYIYHGRGWNGSAVTSYIYTQAVAPPARSMYVSGSGSSANDPIDAVWLTGSTESDSCPLDSSSHQVRIKITNYNATYGSNFSVTVIKRF